MVGRKHGRSGGSGGSRGSGGSGGSGGEVSPLAAQLQQAWLQTQMPKAQKRSFVSVAGNNNQSQQPSRLSSSNKGAEPSAFSSERPSALSALSSLFPELANVQEEKKAMISSVFEEDEHPVPYSPALREQKDQCFRTMIGDKTGNEAQRSHTQRSLSASLVQQSSGSSDFTNTGSISSSHSFSESSQRTASGTPREELAYPNLYSVPAPYSDIDTATEVEVQQEKAPMFSYITEILMDEKLEEKKCMFMEMSAYQAMAKELGDLISYDPAAELYDSAPVSYDSASVPYDSASVSYDSAPVSYDTAPVFYDSAPVSYDSAPVSYDSPSMPESRYRTPEMPVGEDVGVDTWIDEILSGPLPAEFRDSPVSNRESGDKSDHSPEGQCSHTDSQFCNNSSSWKERKNLDGEDAECQSSYLYLDSENSAHGVGVGMGRDLHVDSNPVAPLSNSNGEHQPPVDLTSLLIRCAEAVERSEFGHANELVNELRQHSSAFGNGSQRTAYYFMEALVARMSGTGGRLYSALSNNSPSEAQMLKAQTLFYCEYCPFIQVPHVFANHSIMEAFKGASRVHVVDYGILYGVQWPCLLWQLSQRPGGPPHLRITGIDRPQPGFTPSSRVQDTGRRLARHAKELGVPFEFHAIAEKWEAITPAHLFLRDDEVLVVNSMFRFRHLLDESVTAASPRDLVLSRIKSLNPKIFVQGVLNAGYNAPFFMSRFREALSHFSTLFDAMESSFPLERPERQIIDQEIVGREILNVVACEGLERVERAETYRQWQARTMRAGFQQLPMAPEAWNKVKTAMRSYHRNYGIGTDGSWFLLGWKDHILNAITIWEPIPD